MKSLGAIAHLHTKSLSESLKFVTDTSVTSEDCAEINLIRL